MEFLQISLDDLTQLCNMASLGRLLGGLMHNLNSPLHSLGMQMDVMQHFILKKSGLNDEMFGKVSARLSQMNIEFENLNNQVRIVAMRSDLLEFPPEKLDINHFLHQELEFLKANLYFKHNVETILQLSPSLPPMAPVPPHFNLAIGLFLERLIEELETLESKSLRLSTTAQTASPVLSITVENTAISNDFLRILELDPDKFNFPVNQTSEINLCMSVLLLKEGGVTFGTVHGDSSTSIQLVFPKDEGTVPQGDTVTRSLPV